METQEFVYHDMLINGHLAHRFLTAKGAKQEVARRTGMGQNAEYRATPISDTGVMNQNQRVDRFFVVYNDKFGVLSSVSTLPQKNKLFIWHTKRNDNRTPLVFKDNLSAMSICVKSRGDKIRFATERELAQAHYVKASV